MFFRFRCALAKLLSTTNKVSDISSGTQYISLGGCIVFHWLMHICTQQSSFLDKKTMLAVWQTSWVFLVIKRSPNSWLFDKAEKILAHPVVHVLSRLGSIPHNILVGVPFRSLWALLESCQETSILHWRFHRLVSLHWNSLENCWLQ